MAACKVNLALRNTELHSKLDIPSELEDFAEVHRRLINTRGFKPRRVEIVCNSPVENAYPCHAIRPAFVRKRRATQLQGEMQMQQKMIQMIQVIVLAMACAANVLAAQSPSRLYGLSTGFLGPEIVRLRIQMTDGGPLPLRKAGDQGGPISQAAKQSKLVSRDGGNPLPSCNLGDPECSATQVGPSTLVKEGGPAPLCYPGGQGCPSNKKSM